MRARTRPRIVSVALLSLLAAVTVWAGSEDVSRSYTVDNVNHFDPHNHWPGGIPEWADFVTVFAGGSRPRMFDELRTGCEKQEPGVCRTLLDSPRVWPLTKELLQCKNDLDPQSEDLDKALLWMLTASEYTDWDSAYAVRSMFVESKLGEFCEKRPQLLSDFEAKLGAALALQDITFSEQSASMSEIATCWSPLDLGQPAGKPAPEVLFLAQLTNLVIAADDPLGQTWKRQRAVEGGRGVDCEVASDGKPMEMLTKMRSQLPGLLGLPQVVGVDILAPERNCVTAQGKENFKELIGIVYKAAKDNNKRLVVRAHAGEGYPIFFPVHRARPQRCSQVIAGASELGAMLFADGLPLHYAVAKTNLSWLLDTVFTIRRQPSFEAETFDRHVRIRIGHVTHATPAQAQMMRQLKIEADVNLTSNLVTGALTSQPWVDRGESGALATYCNGFVRFPRDLRQPFATSLCSRLEAFRGHSLPLLLANGVAVMLGTDGPGIEHSSFYQDRWWAEHILETYGRQAGLQDPPPDGLERLAHNAWCHVKWIKGKPSDGPAEGCE